MKLTIRIKLLSMFLALGLGPALILGVVIWSATSNAMDKSAQEYELIAINIADKIDRTLFERYGDVQAFTLNGVIQDTEQWGKAGDDNPIVQAMNAYVDTYDIYYLTILVDLDGNLIAVNSRDHNGRSIDTSSLYQRNFKSESWFNDALAGRFYESADGSFTGTVVEHMYIDEMAIKTYRDEGLALGFTAPVHDLNGQVIAVWKNVTKFSVVEDIIKDAYGDLKQRGRASVEMTLMDDQGKIIVDYDPVTKGTENIVRDMTVIGTFNLAEKNVDAAVRVVNGETGRITKTFHARKKIDQTAGFTPLSGALGFPGMKWNMLVRIDSSEALAASYAVRGKVRSTIGIAAIIIAISAFLFALRMTKPISALLVRAKDIASGDLSADPLEIKSADEIGQLTGAVNDMQTSLVTLVSEVQKASSEVASAATEIAASSEEIATGMERQQQQTSQVSAAVEEMAASVTEVAQKASDASGKAISAGDQATTGGEVVSQTVEGMRAISEQVNESAAAVAELGKRGEEIGEIIGVINDIADQTNLLALNAAIEAARAGEHGRGFAVVADEVRKLAERTTKATEEVSGSIRAIQGETTKAVDRMQSSQDKVDEGVQLAEQAGQALGKIVTESQSLAGMIQSIAAAAEEQSAASSEVSQSVEEINAITNESTEGVRQAAQAAAQLSSKSEQLQELVGQFRLN